MNVLVIESDAVLARVYQRLFTTQGHKVVIADSGQEGVFACEQSKPDCIVLELRLPRLNGIAFLYEIRSYHDWIDIPVVINSYTLTHKLPNTFRKRFGIHAVLYKPTLNISDLLRAVENVKVAV